MWLLVVGYNSCNSDTEKMKNLFMILEWINLEKAIK